MKTKQGGDDDIARFAGFDEFAREISRVRLRNQAAAFVVILSVAFVADFSSIGHTAAFGTIRVALPSQILVCALVLVLLQYTTIGKRSAASIASVGYLLNCGLAGWILGTLGGFDGPYFYTVYILPTFLITVPVALGLRAVTTLGMVAAFVAAFLIPNPSYLEFEHISIAINSLMGLTLLHVFVGHRAYQLNKRTFHLVKERDQALEQAQLRGSQLRKHLEAQAHRVRALADDAEHARSSEREELARTLHDDVGQLLLATRLQLANIDRRLEAAGNEDPLGPVSSLLEDLEGSMRGLIGTLRDADDPDSQVDASIESFVSLARAETGLDVVLQTLPPEKIPVTIRPTLARFVQEGLKNVVKHAQASQVSVQVEQDGSWLMARVVDDGCGVDESAIDKSDGWGIVGLRERIERLGGFIELRPREGTSGASLEASFPLLVASNDQRRAEA